MNLKRIETIVNAVLYEGYILYPYRASATKNRQRWTFGGLYPQDHSLVRAGSEACRMQTQCLLQGPDATLEVRLRFLHLIEREVGELPAPVDVLPADNEPTFQNVDALTIDGQRFYAWQEATEREVIMSHVSIDELLSGSKTMPFAFPGRRDLEPLRQASDAIAGVLVRTQSTVEGEIEVAAESIDNDDFRITVGIINRTQLSRDEEADRNAALLHAFASTHVILGAQEGGFVSLLDPPEHLREASGDCDNIGTYPVLVGEEGERDAMLSSPIILYDYPETATESPGDLFDGTEIDEILSLNILALTDEEKREMTAVDPRARRLLERTEALTAEQLNKLHGTMRQPRPATGAEVVSPFDAWEEKPRLAFLKIGGVDLRVGDRVRLRPRGNADIMDLALDGKTAVIEAIERDFEDQVHVAVTVDDDPGRDFGLARMPGHRFFFSPRELEPVECEARAAGSP